MGDSTTINSPAKGLSMGKVFLAEREWEEKMLIMRTEMQNPSEDSKDQSKFRNEDNKLYRSRSEFLTSERTDFVWLYLGKWGSHQPRRILSFAVPRKAEEFLPFP